MQGGGDERVGGCQFKVSQFFNVNVNGAKVNMISSRTIAPTAVVVNRLLSVRMVSPNGPRR